ncbi:MAG: IclR family transcriptional regulator [Propionibacteriaceae bacterium]
MSNEQGVQSVDRAITALEIIARHGEAGVGEVAGEIGVHKSTASRLLAALESRSLVEQTGDRGRYRLGFGLLRLAGSIPGQLDLTSQGGPVCAELAESVGETVNLAVLQGRHVVNIHQVHGRSAITVNNWVGRPTPLHATSSGKVVLAGLGVVAREDLLGADLERFTEATVVDLPTLHRQLDAAAAVGVATTVEEYEIGLNAIASPIQSFGGTLVGAVSVSGPAYRLTRDALDEIAGTVRGAAAEISRRMGFLEAQTGPR